MDIYGNVENRVITNYGDCTIELDGQGDPTGDIEINNVSAMDRQTITAVLGPNDEEAFDNRGNALYQEIVLDNYDFETSSFGFGSLRSIENFGYDFHDRMAASVVTTYGDEAATLFVSREDISYSVYDEFGNARIQEITGFLDEAAQDVKEFKRIESFYDAADRKWAYSGWANGATILTYTNNETDRVLIDRKDIDYGDYDLFGNVEIQTVDTSRDALGEDRVERQVVTNIFDEVSDWVQRGWEDRTIIEKYT